MTEKKPETAAAAQSNQIESESAEEPTFDFEYPAYFESGCRIIREWISCEPPEEADKK